MRRVGCGLVIAVGVLAAAAALLLWNLQQPPEFYAAAVEVPPAEQEQASDAALAQTSALASDAQRPGAWQALFTEAQANGWLAVDLPRNHGTLLPPEVEDPRVEFVPGGLRLAWRQPAAGGASTVISAEAQVSLIEPETLAVRLGRVRAGTVPLPSGLAVRALEQAAAALGAPLRWTSAEGQTVALVRVPPRDVGQGRVARLMALEFRDGELFLGGETRPAGEGPAAP